MPRKRKFDILSESDKKIYLLRMLLLAMSEGDEVRSRRHTDVYGIACQYGGSYNIKRSDFDLIKTKTIEELVK